jgi:hypothetical protein
MIRYSEHQNNTDEQVEEYITSALNLVARLDPPTDLREAAFQTAVNLYAAKQLVAEQVGSPILGSLG